MNYLLPIPFIYIIIFIIIYHQNKIYSKKLISIFNRLTELSKIDPKLIIPNQEFIKKSTSSKLLLIEHNIQLIQKYYNLPITKLKRFCGFPLIRIKLLESKIELLKKHIIFSVSVLTK